MLYTELRFPKDSLFLVTGGAGFKVVNELPTQKFDAAILAVAHNEFKGLNVPTLLNDKHVIFDVKCILDRNIIDARL